MKPKLLETGVPPYFAVIFSFRLRDVDLSEYCRKSDLFMDKTMRLPGFYGEEAIQLEDRNGLADMIEHNRKWQPHQPTIMMAQSL